MTELLKSKRRYEIHTFNCGSKDYLIEDHRNQLLLMQHFYFSLSNRRNLKEMKVIILLTHKALHQQSPIYIQDLICHYSTSRTLHSSSALRLTPVNFNLKSYGSRAFAVLAPELWNKLPDDIPYGDNLIPFKHTLKTHLFKNYFNIYEFFSYRCQVRRS